MEVNTPALWLVIVTGAASGLLASIVGYALLGLPFVRVRVRHPLRIDASGARVESYVAVTNIRGRPVRIENVWILVRRPRGGPGMDRPRGWQFPVSLAEGEMVKCTFDRRQYRSAIVVAFDSADRIWPRRRWFRVKIRALSAGGLVGWPWQRNGPTDRQMERAVERTRSRFEPQS